MSKRSTLTKAVTVGELDAGYEQWYQQIDRPPWVSARFSMGTRSTEEVRAVVAVVRVAGRKTIRCKVVCPDTGLVRRTIECHVHIQSTIHRYCKHRINSGLISAAFRLLLGPPDDSSEFLYFAVELGFVTHPNSNLLRTANRRPLKGTPSNKFINREFV